jgi:hypothetical protein
VILTNRNKLPQPLVDAVANDSYSRGDSDISVTELIGPPRIRQLKQKWDHVLEEDVSDRIWALLGQMGHAILQKKAENGEVALIEHRFHIKRGGYRLSGQVDYLPASKEIDDWKFCSYHVAKSGPKPEWIQQQNIYRLMAAVNDVEVEKLRIVAIFRDWSKMAASRQNDYPQEQVRVFDLPVWSDEETEAFIAERLRVHKAAETTLPECTAEERWERGAKFALMKKGAKRAVSLHETEAEAEAAKFNAEIQPAKTKKPAEYFIEPRPTQWIRCEHYCAVAPYCTQFRAYMEGKVA